MYNSDHIRQLIIDRLEQQGMNPGIITGFMKSLSRILHRIPNSNLLQVNEQLAYLGWNDYELDYHTYELVIALNENEGM